MIRQSLMGQSMHALIFLHCFVQPFIKMKKEAHNISLYYKSVPNCLTTLPFHNKYMFLVICVRHMKEILLILRTILSILYVVHNFEVRSVLSS